MRTHVVAWIQTHAHKKKIMNSSTPVASLSKTRQVGVEPTAADGNPKAADGDQARQQQLRHALHAWQHVIEDNFPQAQNLAQQAEELWCHDHSELSGIKRHLEHHREYADDLQHLATVV